MLEVWAPWQIEVMALLLGDFDEELNGMSIVDLDRAGGQGRRSLRYRQSSIEDADRGWRAPTAAEREGHHAGLVPGRADQLQARHA